MRACRTCLTKKDLNPLFGDLSAVRFTSKQLYLATGVRIRPNDNLPQEACKSCMNHIKKALDFRFISSKTNEYLQKILKKVKMKSQLKNNIEWSDDDYFGNTDVNKIFLEVKIKNDYLEECDVDNKNNSHNHLDNKKSNNNDFDYQTKYNRKGNNQPDNGNKYLDNEESDNSQLDNEQSCNSQSDNGHNYVKNHKNLDNHNISQFDKHHSFDDKQYSNKKNNQKQVIRAKRRKPKEIIRKKGKNTLTKKLQEVKLKMRNDELNSNSCINLFQESNIKIEDFESGSGNSDISNNSNKPEQAMKVNEISNKHFDGATYLGDDNVATEESNKNNVEVARNMYKDKRNKLMSLAVTPYPPEGPVQCRVCKEHVKVSSFPSHAKRHFAPEFTCEECGRMFRSHAHMLYHQQRMHGREKRLACSLCDFRTVERLKLKNHERRAHSGERPYVCDECGASFRMRNDIVQHMRSHFGVRHVQCELCANLFRSNSELANHRNKVHIRMTYLCYLCPQTYKGRKAVRRHLMNIHGVKENEISNIKYIKSKKYEENQTT